MVIEMYRDVTVEIRCCRLSHLKAMHIDLVRVKTDRV